MDDIKIGSNKSFGTVFFIVFTLIGLYPLLKGGNLNIISILIGIIFLILGILNSRFLTPLNKIWFKFGLLLGQIISPVVMGIIFFLVVTPIAFIMRILGKDVLRLKKKSDNSYWIKKTDLKSKMKNQF
jgi:large-conductance mechanosensitive channel